jgi:hypothetical protein
MPFPQQKRKRIKKYRNFLVLVSYLSKPCTLANVGSNCIFCSYMGMGNMLGNRGCTYLERPADPDG